MKGDKQVIGYLNAVLKNELTAINQYFLHSRMLKDWGVSRLAQYEYGESIDEMKHADRIIERILYLEGIPNLQRLNKVNVGETVPEQFKLDLQLEKEALVRLNDGVKLCRELGDNGTVALLKEILVSEEEHADWLETQLGLIDQIGEQNYLAQQLR